ncbi:PREDICTED: autophagy-related protein 9A-like [Ficedula albicollis]|uniref:autophagy-related protein 9A-like n=1 Tax=Ficedula albicollis TaxID=59894 RepID=UPI0007AD80CD|nr:PREDICTED: autophagy-related protein 9A-like [Ficedula albicollis]
MAAAGAHAARQVMEQGEEHREHREYRRLEECEEDSPPGEEEEEQLLLHVTEGPTDSWHHIKDLDSFFTKIYQFHQRNGFACVLLSDVLELLQFLFVVTFSTFLLCCVDYDVLFATRPLNHSHVPERAKVTLPDAVLPAPQCARRLRGSGWLLFLLVLAGAVWLCRLVTALRRLVGYWEIRSFYIRALGIPAVRGRGRGRAVGAPQPLCVPRRELTELDIHHRILRFRNYTVAMVNKSYAEGLKRAPGSLGARRWSLYARHYLRHFNELGHELRARLGRGHAPATKYMDSFSSPLLAVLARHVGFFAGSVLAVLIVLTVYDEDVLTVQHILTAITLLGLVVTVARSFIPDEHAVWCPEQLLQRVLAHVHYLPEHWQGRAGRAETRAEMAQLFQYKAVGAAPRPTSPGPPPLAPSSLQTQEPTDWELPILGLPSPGTPRIRIPSLDPSALGPPAPRAHCPGTPCPSPCPGTPQPQDPAGWELPVPGSHSLGSPTLGPSCTEALHSRSLSRSALLAEVASAEMSLHAIYLHQLHQQQQQGPGPQPAGAPRHPFVTTGSAARASQLREMPLGGWAEEEEEEEEETMT